MDETAMQADPDKKRKQRNLAIAGSIVAFIVVIYLVTFLRISGAATGAGG